MILKGNKLSIKDGRLKEGIWLRGKKCNEIYKKYKSGGSLFLKIPYYDMNIKMIIDEDNYNKNKILLKEAECD